ncbi:MAG: hypothetical protein KY468_18305 [Armatimonadetes bacterium]|nr:hypothetical protein [Armatimonadota bacterium]
MSHRFCRNSKRLPGFTALLLGFISALPAFAAPSPGFVTTVAGYGIQGPSHNDMNLVSPGLAASDDEGGIYFPDTGNHIVYNRDDWNITAPIAGTGLPGFSGDGGPARQARLNRPKGVAARGGSRVNDPSQFPEVDPNKPVGVLYIADTGNHRIRKVYQDPTTRRDLIITLAGDGTPHYKGDGGPALSAGFVSPEGIAADSKGVVYVADRLDHRVRRIDANGNISTVAGTGVPGFSGDGGSAAQAQLNEPTAVIVDKNDVLYISDTKNHRIRRVAKDGTITTFIGGGLRLEDGRDPTEIAIRNPTGMAIDELGAFYFTDGLRVRVLQDGVSLIINTHIQDEPEFVTALRNPQNPVSVYLMSRFTEEMRQKIAAYDTDGYPSAAFTFAFITALNEVIQGPNIYDSERFSQVNLSEQVRKLIQQNPQGEGLVRLNRMLLDETYTPEILARNMMDGKVYPFAGNGQEGFLGENGSPTQASFFHPYGITVPSVERLVITDDVARRVRAVNAGFQDDLYITTVIGKALYDDTLARSARITLPLAVSPAPDGTALIADHGNRRIRVMQPPCSDTLPRQPYYLYTAVGKGIPQSGPNPNPCRSPGVLPASYGPTADGARALEAEIGPPTGVAGQRGGVYYFSEGEKGRVWQVDSQGLLHAVAVPGGLTYPAGLALAPDGRLFITDRDSAKVWVKDGSGVTLFAATEAGDGGDSGPAIQARLNAPEAVAAGPDGSVYIADTGNHKVKRVSPDGRISTVAGTGAAGYALEGPAASVPLNAPRGVAVDTDGALYIADTGNHRIVRVKNGALEPVSGGPDPGHPETDPLTRADLDEWAGEAKWHLPAGIAFDGAGHLYVADSNNHRIRMIANAAAARFGVDPSLMYGDVTDDKNVDINDVIVTLRIAVELVQPTASQKRRADVAPRNPVGGPPGDGRVDASDAIRILRRIIRLGPDGEWP